MGYMHIDNLYKPASQEIMNFRTVYVLEKIHGTSAHVGYNASTKELHFFTGELKDQFLTLFDPPALKSKFTELFGDLYDVVVYGEHYGGKIQGQSRRYGAQAKFVAFDVKLSRVVGGSTSKEDSWWMDVPKAASCVGKLGLDFVDFALVDCTLDELNRWRDKPSVQAQKNGVVDTQQREGVVIRPPVELYGSQGRLIAKHKADSFRETATPRDPGKAQRVFEDRAVAGEFVTLTRLEHVMQKIPSPHSLQQIPDVISAMIEDIEREGRGEFSSEQGKLSDGVRKQVGKATVILFRDWLKGQERVESL